MFNVRQFIPLCSNCFRRSYYNRNIFQTKRYLSQKENIDYDDGPIQYSTSRASKYKAKATRTGIEEERLSYEPSVILVSIGVFLLYFCVFREENDIDKELNRTLYSRIEGLEESQLKLSLKYNMDQGMDTTAIRQRLKEIELEKQNNKGAHLE